MFDLDFIAGSLKKHVNCLTLTLTDIGKITNPAQTTFKEHKETGLC